MKKYHLGYLKALKFLIPIAIAFVATLIMFPISTIIETEAKEIIFHIMIPLLVVIIGVIVFIIIRYKKREKALSGRRTTGVVTYCCVHSDRSGKTLNLEIQYKTEAGEDAILVTEATPKLEKYFSIGKRIPLYVNGKYAYFKEEEIYETIDRSIEK